MGKVKNWFTKSFTVPERRLSTSTAPSIGTSRNISTTLYENYGASYAYIYQHQPNVRTVVDFLARNIAQLNIKAFERVEDTERRELQSHPAIVVLRRPNPYTTRFRMMRNLVSDLAIYDNAYWVKIRSSVGEMALVQVPPKYVTVRGSSALHPDSYTISPYGNSDGTTVGVDEMIHFRGYDPEDGRAGYPPLETLRRTLAQEDAAGRHMEKYWKQAARREIIIERPLLAPEWNDEKADRFIKSWENRYTGEAGAGRPLMLEDGMTAKESSFSPKDSEWAEGRRLSMEIVARSFHIPLPMIGLMGSSNWATDEYHSMLYTETLAPWLTMIQEELELSLLPEFPGSGKVYFEFNLDEKLRGSFEKQAALASTLVGGPVVTTNEFRARLNLPPVPGGDTIVTPLNVVRGGGPQADPQHPMEVPVPDPLKGPVVEDDLVPRIATKAAPPVSDDARGDYATTHEQALRKFFTHQRDAYGSTKAAGAKWDAERWNRELQEKMFELGRGTITLAGRKASLQFEGSFDVSKTDAWLDETSRVRAENINATTAAALAADESVTKDVFDHLLDVRTVVIAATVVTALVNFASHEAAHQSGVKSKVWNVVSANSRHPEMDGETVPVDAEFSNGMRWPGDSAGGIEETVNCQCLLSYE